MILLDEMRPTICGEEQGSGCLLSIYGSSLVTQTTYLGSKELGNQCRKTEGRSFARI